MANLLFPASSLSLSLFSINFLMGRVCSFFGQMFSLKESLWICSSRVEGILKDSSGEASIAEITKAREMMLVSQH
jgi:hypothetical protein